MPIFVKKCKKCGMQFDFYKLRESSLLVCPKCGNDKDFNDIPSAPAITFKGEGWTTRNHSAEVDPTSVPGVKKVEAPTKRDRAMYKFKKKEATGRRRKIKIRGLREKKRG